MSLRSPSGAVTKSRHLTLDRQTGCRAFVASRLQSGEAESRRDRQEWLHAACTIHKFTAADTPQSSLSMKMVIGARASSCKTVRISQSWAHIQQGESTHLGTDTASQRSFRPSKSSSGTNSIHYIKPIHATTCSIKICSEHPSDSWEPRSPALRARTRVHRAWRHLSLLDSHLCGHIRVLV